MSDGLVLVGFAGRKGCGKTTAAKWLAEDSFKIWSFATPIKAMLSALLSYQGFDDDEMRFLLSDPVAKEDVLAGFDRSPRYLMQTLGTEWGRKCVHADLWVRLVESRLTKTVGLYIESHVVFDDVRFENEADMIRRLGGVIVHIERDGLPGGDDYHASEAGIRRLVGDVVVKNSGDKDDFLAAVDAALESVGIL